ncbi:type II toxin-antitoxin system RelE family toxin [Desulforegula conservatrix]|uniref:type II toxin-antitoxin system RelE family toxin n=1 Tax=Desulforegula conservatrix TaxID=153026 RepID=UPI00042907CE|nr:type II toxin-antitoxin system RelE/ParE family toxin [Desulforegula conservatrix]
MYNLKFKQSVAKDLKKIGREEGEKILKAIKEKLLPDPSCGKGLKGNLAAIWSFRTGDYRVLYTFNDSELVVLVLRIGHRREVYER